MSNPTGRPPDAGLIAGSEPGPEASPTALATLFARLAQGDREALGPIYDGWAREIHSLALWRTGRAEEAAEVVQEVFVKLAGTHAHLESVRNPRRYLLAMAHRAAIDQGRKHRHCALPEETILLEESPSDPGRRLDARRASRLLLSLPARQREAIYLRHFSDLTFREMAKVLRVPTFTAASRYRIGILRLRKLMGEAL